MLKLLLQISTETAALSDINIANFFAYLMAENCTEVVVVWVWHMSKAKGKCQNIVRSSVVKWLNYRREKWVWHLQNKRSDEHFRRNTTTVLMKFSIFIYAYIYSLQLVVNKTAFVDEIFFR